MDTTIGNLKAKSHLRVIFGESQYRGYGGGWGVPPGAGSRNGSEHGLRVERVQSTGLGVEAMDRQRGDCGSEWRA